MAYDESKYYIFYDKINHKILFFLNNLLLFILFFSDLFVPLCIEKRYF